MKKVLLIVLSILLFICGCGRKEETPTKNIKEDDSTNKPVVEEKKESINPVYDSTSKARPFAVVFNNTPVAIKVQTGLADAYIVYEIPVEGSMSRILAIFKDKATEKIGTIRSARHDFLDYVMENDAIFVHWGYSHYAQDQIKSLKINNINGLADSGFWRENPEKLATEHTGYTSLVKAKKTAEKKNYRLTTDQKSVLNYSDTEIDLSKLEGSKEANTISIPYGSFTAKYEYDKENKNYKRYSNGKANTDYETKKQYTAKNIIVTKITYQMADDNYYWDLNNTGSGKGFYITNGYYVPITWEKSSRSAKTIYKYADGTELKVNNDNTWIELQTTKKTLTIK